MLEEVYTVFTATCDECAKTEDFEVFADFAAHEAVRHLQYDMGEAGWITMEIGQYGEMGWDTYHFCSAHCAEIWGDDDDSGR